MNVSIKKEVFDKFNPKLKVGFVVVKGIDNKAKLKQSKHLLIEAEQLVHLTFNQETFRNHYLIEPWTAAKLEFGKKARHYHTSVEKLLKTVLQKKSIGSKNTLTNLLQYLALKHIIPFGADDLKKITGGLTFNVAKGKEKINVLKKLKKGALYYRDSKDVLGTKLDYWKNFKTALTPKTKSALIHFEAVPPFTEKKLNEVVKEAESLIKSFCGGRTKVFVLGKKKSSMKV